MTPSIFTKCRVRGWSANVLCASAAFCLTFLGLQDAMAQFPPGPGGANAPAAADKADKDAQGSIAVEVGDEIIDDGVPRRLKFSSAPLTLLLEAYAEATGRTLLLAPSLPTANINLRSQTDLNLPEYLDAIETVLGMHGVALLREGDRFLRIVANKDARQEPMVIRTAGGDFSAVRDSGKLNSQLIPLKHIEIAEAQKAIESLKHAYGTIHAFESINSMLVTDTAATINRVVEMVGYIDQPILAREEPNIIQIRYAKASDIKAKLLEIVEQAQLDQKKSTVPRQRNSGAPGVVATPTANRAGTPSRAVPGVVRAPRTPDAVASNVGASTLVEEGERGLIRGDVKIIEDDRTNILILITRPENMPFFQTIIKVLDVETAPDVMVQVYRLEYAEADKVAGMLNDLIGAARSDDAAPATAAGKAGETGEAAALREYVAKQAATAAKAAVSEKSASKVGELSTDNVKILSDERTNALIIMASKSEHGTLGEIIADMDTMLSQVLIEVVILEINLNDSLETGVDWLQRAMVSVDQNADGTRRPVTAWAGSGGGGANAVVDPTSLTAAGAFPAGTSGAAAAGLSYYLTLFDINVDMVLRAVATDSRARLLSSPVIVTTDNKDASIDVSTERYFFKGKRYAGTGGVGNSAVYEDDVERKSVGINLAVTPRINEKKFVVMEIVQKIEDVTGTQKINDEEWPIVSSRTLEADVSVRSGDTIVLGGLIQNRELTSRSKIPILGDIPILGIPFRADSKEGGRTELIVFITPYVLDTPEDVIEDTVRRQESMHMDGMWKRGWSNSMFAEPQKFGPYEASAALARASLADSEDEAAQSKRAKRKRREVPVDESERVDMPLPEVGAPVPGDSKYVEWDPMAEIDPALRKYIEVEGSRFENALENLDKRVEP